MKRVWVEFRDEPFNLVLVLALVYAGYFVLRYGGLWIENDTSVFSTVAQLSISSGDGASAYYSHGFGYTDWLAALSLLTHISVQTCNTVIAPFIGAVLLVVPGYVCYKLLLRDKHSTLFATLVLLAIPELMFSALRGNHEKLNIIFVYAGLYALLKAFQCAQQRNLKETALWTIFYYIMVYGNACVNDYFASTISFANLPTMVLLRLFLPKSERKFIGKLGISVVTSFLIVFLVMFYLFPAAGTDFSLLSTATQKVNSLVMTMQPSSNPYTEVTQAWAGQTASELMSMFRDMVFALSFVVMVTQLWQVWIKKKAYLLSDVFLLSLYLSFGLIIVISIPVDMVGLAAGSNLEVRNYTYFTIMAAPMIGWGIQRLLQMRRWRLVMEVVIPPALMFFIVLGVTKTTLDPVFSNNWLLYSTSEKQAIEDYMKLSPDGMLWTGPDNRLTNLAHTIPISSGDNTNIVGYDISSRPEITDVLWSTEINAYMTDRANTEPNTVGQDLVYDNGDALIYHRRPLTPYQH